MADFRAVEAKALWCHSLRCTLTRFHCVHTESESVVIVLVSGGGVSLSDFKSLASPSPD